MGGIQAKDGKPATNPAPVPPRLDLKVGFACNNRCQFCVQGNKRERFGRRSRKELDEILTTNADRVGVVFTGGEPTLHPDIRWLVARARELGYQSIQVQSNGRMFAYKSFLQRARQSRCNRGVSGIARAPAGAS